jgi:hypothetical protein
MYLPFCSHPLPNLPGGDPTVNSPALGKSSLSIDDTDLFSICNGAHGSGKDPFFEL